MWTRVQNSASGIQQYLTGKSSGQSANMRLLGHNGFKVFLGVASWFLFTWKYVSGTFSTKNILHTFFPYKIILRAFINGKIRWWINRKRIQMRKEFELIEQAKLKRKQTYLSTDKKWKHKALRNMLECYFFLNDHISQLWYKTGFM